MKNNLSHRTLFKSFNENEYFYKKLSFTCLFDTQRTFLLSSAANPLTFVEIQLIDECEITQ